LQKSLKSRSPNGILTLFAKFYSIKKIIEPIFIWQIHDFCSALKTVSTKMNYNHSKSMLKRTSILLIFLSMVLTAGAQITPTANLFQNSMAPFQATALPYNYLDKFEQVNDPSPAQRRIKPNQKSNVGLYVNLSSRAETYPETDNWLKNTYKSGICSIDFIQNPHKMSYKIGGGVMYHELQIVQLISPFLHFSLGMPIGEQWRLLGGANYRYAQSRLDKTELDYQHPFDPKIPLSDPKTKTAMQDHNNHYHSIGMSVAAVHTEKLYFGLGVNRILDTNQFGTARKQNFTGENFTELNLLFQTVLWKRYKSHFVRDKETGKRVDMPNRGFLSNVNLSVAARYLMGTNYPYVQVSCRATLMPKLWVGVGWNTANRIQLQVGFMELPLFKQDVEKEWYLWAGYDFPTQNTPYRGTEINLGYYF
jgi:Type IX secretion system membrane protein PorP/SprF